MKNNIDCLSVDEVRVMLYKDRIRNNISQMEQLNRVGISDPRCYTKAIFYKDRKHPPVWFRIFNYLIEIGCIKLLKGGVQNESV